MTGVASVEDVESLFEAFVVGQDGWGTFREEVGSSFEVPGLGAVTVVESVGGEDQGSHIHVVLTFMDGTGRDRFFMKSGAYSSWDGTEWDGDFVEVGPHQKVITYYEAV